MHILPGSTPRPSQRPSPLNLPRVTSRSVKLRHLSGMYGGPPLVLSWLPCNESVPNCVEGHCRRVRIHSMHRRTLACARSCSGSQAYRWRATPLCTRIAYKPPWGLDDGFSNDMSSSSRRSHLPRGFHIGFHNTLPEAWYGNGNGDQYWLPIQL